MYKLKEGIRLRQLQDFGYKYVGNYNRGDQWLKEIDIIVDGKNLGGILIQEWGEISFRFPFIKNIKYPDIEPYIQDLIQANLVVKEKNKMTEKKERCKYCVEYNGDCVEESGGFDYYSCELKNKEDLEKYGAYWSFNNRVDEDECTHYLCESCLFRKENKE